MKKFFSTCTVFWVAAILASPGMAADFKMTWNGSMEVLGHYISNDVIKTGETSNDWYDMKLEVEPTFHINDNLRIHNLVTIMERNWGGNVAPTVTGGTYEVDNSLGTGGPVAGNYSYAHNFWWERCYASFPIQGGMLSVGRMSGGRWAHPFMDDSENRDRIKYVKKFGENVLLGVIEKLSEEDGGGALGGSADFQESDTDIDAYAVGGVFPLSDDFTFKPLLYWVNYGGGSAAGLYSEGADQYLTLNGCTFKRSNLRLDAEIDYIWGTMESATGADTDWKQLLWWIDVAMTQDATDLAIGAWYVQGEEADNDKEINSIYGMGNEFQPLLIATGEHANLLNDHDDLAATGTGVDNGLSEGKSGMIAYYLRGTHKMNDKTSMRFIWGMIEADEMASSGHDDELGMEFDIGVDHKLMDNLTYSATVGYFWTGDYYKTGTGTTEETDDVYMISHGVAIEF